MIITSFRKVFEIFSMKQYSAVILFFIVFSINALSQDRYGTFSYFTIDDGLSSNRVRCIMKDYKGYLWVGTDMGLDRYDSYMVKRYRKNENKSGSISSDQITCIFEDSRKRLWIGTDGGLNLYDRNLDNFSSYRNSPADPKSLYSNLITGIVEDKNGIIWIVTDGSSLNRWNSADNDFIRYPFDTKQYNLSVRPSRMAAIDSKGEIWIGSISPELVKFDPQTGQFTRFDDPTPGYSKISYKSLYIDKDDKVWVASDGNGFFCFDPATNSYEHFGVKGDNKGTNLNFVLDVIPESDRFLLLAVDQGGINRFDKQTKLFQYIRYDESIANGLNNNGITCFHRDKDNILWVGTSGGGINFISPEKERFKLFRHSIGNSNTLSYNFTGSLFEDHEGKIWIGTDGGGLNVYDPVTGNFKIFKKNPADPNSISGNVIRGIAEDKDHNMWIGTWDAGLNCYDRKTGKFRHYLPDPNNPSSISDKTIWNVFIDHNNRLWLSIYNIGLDIFDTEKGVVKRYRPDKNNISSLSGSNCWFTYEDDSKNIWICTQNGLSLFVPETESFKVYHFPNDNIGSFYTDRKGYIWVGTNTHGLFMCNKDGTILKNYNESNILLNNRIHAITEDNSGNIWISSNSGLSRINTGIQSVRNYTREDGLQGDQFYQQSFLKTRAGELYFGGYSGLTSFFPDSLRDNTVTPPVYITDFQIFNKPVSYGGPGSQFPVHISEASEIRLRWDQSIFSLSFAAISYQHQSKNRYKYKLDGFEKEWNYTDASRRFVTYTNLDPGTYTFMVGASNSDEIWNDDVTTLKIIVLPPWWLTIWFKISVVVTGILVIYIIFRRRVNQLKKQQLILEKTVALKTAELNEMNATKDKFFSIIAHDLKNPFNTIIGFSEMMKESLRLNDTATFLEYSSMINTAAIQTLRLLENLLEWANTQRGKIQFNPVDIELRALVNEEFYVNEEVAVAKKIDLYNLVDEHLVIQADRNMLKTILRNLISNAIKFTERNGRVTVTAREVRREVIVSVTDNGIGLTPEKKAKIFKLDAGISSRGTENEHGTGLGLFLCKEFVEKHGGRIWVTDAEGKGSEFNFAIPLIHT
jgi:signal transduction histidine kinase/ligand-binding sensor domain-containing protein